MRRSVWYSIIFSLLCVSLAMADATLSVTQVSGRPGRTVTVPVTIDDATDVAGGSITLTFNESVVTATAVNNASLINGFRFVSNIVGNEARFAFANAAGLPQGSGDIATVSFTVDADATGGARSPLTLSNAVLYNEQAQPIGTATSSSGSLTVNTEAPTVQVSVSPPTAKNGQTVTLTVTTEIGATVTADISDLDTTQPNPVSVPETTPPGTYTTQVTISDANQADNGTKTITATATIGQSVGTGTSPITLQNFLEFDLNLPVGVGMIHLPLSTEIQSIADLHAAIGQDNVDAIITYDPQEKIWRPFLNEQDRGNTADATITADLGILAVIRNALTLNLKGDAWGVDGVSQIDLNAGTNFVGVPLRDERIKRVSDLLSIDGIKDNAVAIIVSDGGKFKVVARPGDDGDIAVTGGQAFIITALSPATAEIRGDGWDNVTGNPPAVPPIEIVGYQADGKTPVLAVHGDIVEEVAGLGTDGYRITVKNLSTGALLNTVSGSDRPDGGYSMVFFDTRLSRFTQVGDVLEVRVETPASFIGVQPLRYNVTPEDVKTSRIRLPELVAYQIPTETELRLNYPNPFNPETWIPYRLAKDAFVKLTIYDTAGQIVRSIDVGHKPAAVYESKAKAIYWDGRNNFGERVASGIYFYTLIADDFSATRKMLILK